MPTPVARDAPGAYVPLDGRPFRLAMGLRPLDLSRWLEGGPDVDAQRAEKRWLLAARRDEVLIVQPAGEAGAIELLAEVSRATGADPSVDEADGSSALAAAALLVAEDLCVLVETEGRWWMAAACVCFPSRWRLSDKVGADVAAIHAPVPGYADTLARPVDAFFTRLTAERAFWRLNWTLLDDPALFQPGPARQRPALDPAALTFRVERQTLRRLPRTGAVIFTIRTYAEAAGRIAERDPAFAADVLAVLATAPAATVAYKGWEGLAAAWADRFGLERPQLGQPPAASVVDESNG